MSLAETSFNKIKRQSLEIYSLLTDPPVWMQLYNLVCSPVSDRKKDEDSLFLRAGGDQESKGPEESRCCADWQRDCSLCVLCAELKHLHRIFFPLIWK